MRIHQGRDQDTQQKLYETFDDTTLEQRPNVLDSVCVNAVFRNVFDRVIHFLMNELRVLKPVISRELIGVNLGSGLCVLADKFSKRFRFNILSRTEADFS